MRSRSFSWGSGHILSFRPRGSTGRTNGYDSGYRVIFMVPNRDGNHGAGDVNAVRRDMRD